MRQNTYLGTLAALVLVAFGLVGCLPLGIRNPEPFLSPIAVSPTVEEMTQPWTSPLATPVVLPSATSTDRGRFQLDRPLLAGATRVSGRGPAGLGITIVDVTMSGEVIGSGEIGEDGSFGITVKPLLLGNRVGIMANGQLPSEGQGSLDLLWGEGGIQLPMIGDVFATAVVSGP
jgi:hypothetical protein